uniref:SDR family oxidoreductase n=1 Tax=uncultured Boseongicola sp. TaxID=1648499 RepID=UPI002639F342
VNYIALTRLTKHLLSLINDGGAIVNMASRAGAHWRENYAQVQRLNSISGDIELDDFVQREVIDPVRAYDLSKEAVILWTKEMVAPLRARGLRINAASPAAVDTPILGDFMTALGERAERGLVITGRAGRAEEIARTLVFLASPEASWITGCNIECDGGLTAELDLSALKKAHVG